MENTHTTRIKEHLYTPGTFCVAAGGTCWDKPGASIFAPHEDTSACQSWYLSAPCPSDCRPVLHMLCSARKLHALSGLLQTNLTGRKIYMKGTGTLPANDTHTTPQNLHPSFDTCVPLPQNSHTIKSLLLFTYN